MTNPVCPYCKKNDETILQDNSILSVGKDDTPEAYHIEYLDEVWCNRCDLEFGVRRES